MQLKGIEAYWSHWVSLAEAESPFTFLSIEGSQDGNGSEAEGVKGNANDEDEEDGGEKRSGGSKSDDEESTRGPNQHPLFAVDEGMSLPSECSTPAERTAFLKSLAQDTPLGRVFGNLVMLVDATEVSLIPVIQSLSLVCIISGYRCPQCPHRLKMAMCSMVMGRCSPARGDPW